MRENLRNGARAGVTFGIILIFLALVGFTVTATELIGGVFSTDAVLEAGVAIPGAVIRNFIIFVVLLGLWAGARGARPTEPDSWGGAVAAGLAAGIVAGLVFSVFILITGSVEATGVDMRSYFAALSSQAVRLIEFDQAPIVGSLLEIVTLGAAGLVGGLLARGLGRGAWREPLAERRKALGESIRNIAVIRQMQDNPASRWVLYGAILVVVFAMPSFLGRYWNYNMGTVGIYVLLGLGLNIVVGMAGLLDLGYVAFFAIGAYSVALLTAPEPHGLLWSFWAALPVGVVLAGLAGILLGIPVLRLRGDYLAIVTLGFGEIIRILSKSDLLTGFSGGPRGVRDVAGPVLFGHPFSDERQFMYLIIIGCLLVVFVTSRLQNSRVGRAWIAMREDETVAQAMGINTWQYKLMAFAIGAAFAGLGGVLFASRNQFTGPEDHNLLVSINVLSLVIVGGMGSIPGVIVGALALKGLPEILRQIDAYRMLAFGGLLVAMMVLRPEGIWPSRRRRMELEALAEDEEEPPPEPLTPSPGGEAV